MLRTLAEVLPVAAVVIGVRRRRCQPGEDEPRGRGNGDEQPCLDALRIPPSPAAVGRPCGRSKRPAPTFLLSGSSQKVRSAISSRPPSTQRPAWRHPQCLDSTTRGVRQPGLPDASRSVLTTRRGPSCSSYGSAALAVGGLTGPISGGRGGPWSWSPLSSSSTMSTSSALLVELAVVLRLERHGHLGLVAVVGPSSSLVLDLERDGLPVLVAVAVQVDVVLLVLGASPPFCSSFTSARTFSSSSSPSSHLYLNLTSTLVAVVVDLGLVVDLEDLGPGVVAVVVAVAIRPPTPARCR